MIDSLTLNLQSDTYNFISPPKRNKDIAKQPRRLTTKPINVDLFSLDGKKK